MEELKPYEVALGPELLDQVENLLRDLDMPPVKVGRRNNYLLSHAVNDIFFLSGSDFSDDFGSDMIFFLLFNLNFTVVPYRDLVTL